MAEDEQVDTNGTVIPGSGVQLTSKIHVLAKQDQFEYFIDDLIPLETTPGNTTTNISETAITFPSTSRNLGQLKFSLVQDRITELKNNFSMVGATPNLKSKFDALTGQPEKQTLVGLAYQINAIEYEGLINSNDHVKFTRAQSGSAGKIIITVDSTVDLNHFIIDREVILSANTTTNTPSAMFQFINNIADDILPNDYKVCKIESINTTDRQITLTKTGATAGSFNVDLSSSTDDYLVGFKNTFLIAKGRILV